MWLARTVSDIPSPWHPQALGVSQLQAPPFPDGVCSGAQLHAVHMCSRPGGWVARLQLTLQVLQCE